MRKFARELKFDEIESEQTRRLVKDMVQTMHELGGIGLAAPQIGESVQLAVIEIPPNSERYPHRDPFPLSVLINPRVRVIDKTEQEFWEGCLSIPNLRGLVVRPRQISVDYLDHKGESRNIVVEDFLATVVQHELDHLLGVLFIDRVRDTTKLATDDEYVRYWMEEPPLETTG